MDALVMTAEALFASLAVIRLSKFAIRSEARAGVIAPSFGMLAELE